MAAKGNSQLILSALYSRKFAIEYDIKMLKLQRASDQQMFPHVYNDIMDALIINRQATDNEIDQMWNMIQKQLDAGSPDDQKNRVYRSTIGHNQCPF